MTNLVTITPHSTESSIEAKIARVGTGLMESLGAVLGEIPGAPLRPKELANTLSVDTVLTSRLLKSLRGGDPLAAVHHTPGPDPLRRLLKAAAKQKGVRPASIEAANQAIQDLVDLIRVEAGSRSALNAMIASLLPEARAEFELRRKQSAFKALSELKGASVDLNFATFVLWPSKEEGKIDLVMLVGLLGMRRWQAGATIKAGTIRLSQEGEPTLATALDGTLVEGLEGLRLDEFCTAPPSQIETVPIGDTGHYLIGGSDFGPRSAVDLIYGERNHGAMVRYLTSDEKRKNATFVQSTVPSKLMIHDLLVHPDLFQGQAPELLIYDTSESGVANVNDRNRDVDLWDLEESLVNLGTGTTRFRASELPRYVDLLRHTFMELGLNGEEFRGYRARIDYPIYCCQVAIAFQTPSKES